MERLLKSKYRIGEKLSSREICTTYQGVSLSDNLPIVIKIYKRTWLDSQLIKNLRESVPVLTRLSHSKIASLLDGDYGWQGFYFIRESAPGKSLADLITENHGLDPDRILEVAVQIAQALEAAHNLNIVHGALKPNNIFVTENYQVKVTDFGIESAVRKSTRQNAERLLENARFFSPEEIKGFSSQPSSDIYKAGLLLYLMLTKTLPFKESDNLKTALAHLRQIPGIKSSAPKYLEQITLKCLEKDPLLRFTSARELKENLQAKTILSPSNLDLDLPSLKLEEDVGEEVSRERKSLKEEARFPYRLVLVGGILAAILAGVFYSLIQPLLGR